MRLVANIFEPKATRVVRCLLVNIGKGWTVRKMANEANTAVGYTHAVLATLINMGYAKRDERNNVVLLDPEILLRRWVAFYQYEIQRQIEKNHMPKLWKQNSNNQPSRDRFTL
jgi:hypothetical protein